MIIYRCIFEKIFAPFMGMGDNDKLENKIRKYEKRKDFDGLCSFNENLMVSNMEWYNINYIKSRNIQKTLFYYFKCKNNEEIRKILGRDLIHFENLECFLIPLINIYDKISHNIGEIYTECYKFKENIDMFDKVFESWEEAIKYMNQ